MDDGSIADQRFIPRGSAVHHMERARCTDRTMERRDAVGVGSSAQKKQRQQGVQCLRVGSEGAAACFPLRILYDDAGWSQQSRSAGDRLPSRGSRRSGPTAQREKKTFFSAPGMVGTQDERPSAEWSEPGLTADRSRSWWLAAMPVNARPSFRQSLREGGRYSDDSGPRPRLGMQSACLAPLQCKRLLLGCGGSSTANLADDQTVLGRLIVGRSTGGGQAQHGSHGGYRTGKYSNGG